MRFSLDSKRLGHIIHGYEGGQILIDNRRYTTSLLLMESYLNASWGPTRSCDLQLSDAHIAVIADLNPEVVIIGTGVKQLFPPVRVFARLISAGIGFEVMDTGAACRTYSVLAADRRRVLGALFP